ncbi:hypothetical protein ABPG74_018707 [Tetrahymena malaccensis]
MSVPQIQDDSSVIEPTFQELRQTFLSQKTKSLAYRKQQLRNLLRGLTEMEQEFHKALEKDLKCSPFISYMTSFKITISEIEHTLKNLDSWVKARPLDTTVISGPAKTYLKPEPYGVALVMSAWNYPLFTAIPPFAQALAAGNCVVLKPSELAPYTSNCIQKLFTNYMDKTAYRCIEGQVQVSINITKLPWGLIIFTGSPEKGKLVAKAASENLVPCILELGGKSPTIVDQDANLENAALRVTQGRFLNAGQTCVACDYLFVHKSVKAEFIKKLKEKIVLFYGEDPQKSNDYNRIINCQSTERLASLLNPEDHKGQIVIGGKYDISDKYVAPTLIDQPSLESRVMKEEIFGPILPILEFTDIQTVVQFINERPNPLALYYFGSKHAKLFEEQTSSGSYSINDAIFQLTNPNLPFGGVGNSGSGKYHGLAGFDSCSHLKPVFNKLPINSFPFSARYPPYTETKQSTLKVLFATAQFNQSTGIKWGLAIIALIILSKFSYNGALQNKARQLLSQLQTKFSNL